MEDNSLKIRVKKIFEHYQVNAQIMEQRTGIASNTFRNLINGTTKNIYITTIFALLKEFPLVDANWLMTGRGNMQLRLGDKSEMVVVNDRVEEYACKMCMEKNGQIKQLKEYNQQLIEKNEIQSLEIGKLTQQLTSCDCDGKKETQENRMNIVWNVLSKP